MMLNKISYSLLYIFISIAKSEPPSNEYGSPLGTPLSSYGTPNYHANGNDQSDHDYNGGGEPKAYEFGYQVKDDYTGTNYNRKESSDGNQVRGEYRVALPDGRTQIVTYWADWQSGFHADVRYEGEAHYPEQYNKGGYDNGGYSDNGGQYGAPSYNNNNNNGYNGGGAASSVAINSLANDHDGYNYNNNFNSFSDGYSSKQRPSTEYGAI